MRYSDEEKAAIMAESRRTLDELMQPYDEAGAGEIIEADLEFRGSPDWLEQMLAEDPFDRWRREQDQAERARQAEEERIIRQRQQAAERAARRTPEAMPEIWSQAIGEFGGIIRKQLCDRIERLDAEAFRSAENLTSIVDCLGKSLKRLEARIAKFEANQHR